MGKIVDAKYEVIRGANGAGMPHPRNPNLVFSGRFDEYGDPIWEARIPAWATWIERNPWKFIGALVAAMILLAVAAVVLPIGPGGSSAEPHTRSSSSR